VVEIGLKYYELDEKEKEKVKAWLRQELAREKGVVFAYVYGGFVRRNFLRDIDVAVWVGEGEDPLYYTVDLSVKLEVELGIPVDVQVLNGAPLPFRYRVFAEGILLFSRDERLRAEVVNSTIREYLDFQFLLKIVKEAKRSEFRRQ